MIRFVKNAYLIVKFAKTSILVFCVMKTIILMEKIPMEQIHIVYLKIIVQAIPLQIKNIFLLTITQLKENVKFVIKLILRIITLMKRGSVYNVLTIVLIAII